MALWTSPPELLAEYAASTLKPETHRGKLHSVDYRHHLAEYAKFLVPASCPPEDPMLPYLRPEMEDAVKRLEKEHTRCRPRRPAVALSR